MDLLNLLQHGLHRRGARHGGVEALEGALEFWEGRGATQGDEAHKYLQRGQVPVPLLPHAGGPGMEVTMYAFFKDLGEDEFYVLKVSSNPYCAVHFAWAMAMWRSVRA